MKALNRLPLSVTDRRHWISAGLLKGRRATGYRSVAEELKEAGALYEDKDVVIDDNLVTSREPSDLPAFMRETMKQLRL